MAAHRRQVAVEAGAIRQYGGGVKYAGIIPDRGRMDEFHLTTNQLLDKLDTNLQRTMTA